MKGKLRGLGALLFTLLTVARAGTGALSGFVRDGATGEPLAYANIELKGTGSGTVTNARGYFYLGPIAPGEYELEVSYIGYASVKKLVTVVEGKTVSLNFELRPEPVRVGEVRVSAERARFEREVTVSATRLDTRQLAVVPKLGGEVDLLRTVQLLPGVITVSDFSNKLYIRGGSPDQNLILLDGITVYNPAHLFGIFSPFVPEAIADVTLRAGGFDARYGNRLSSVLDITTRAGNSRRYTGSAAVSPIAARGIAEGPIPHGAFLLAGRRTYLPEVLLRAFGVAGLDYYFYDIMGKINYAVREDSRFALSGLGAEDVLSFSDPQNPNTFRARLAWGNRGFSAGWNAVFNPLFYGAPLFAWSNFTSGFRVEFPSATPIQLRTDLNTFTLKSDFTHYPADAHTLNFGLEVQANRMALRVESDSVLWSAPDTLFISGLYLEDQWEAVQEKLFLKPGLRLVFYSNGGRFEPEPRLGVKFRFEKNTALNCATGRFTQPLVTLNSTEPVFALYDVWVPVPERRPIPSAWHYIAGVERWLKNDLTVQFEGYFKQYAHLLETRYGAYFTPPESLLDAAGRSWGAELFLRKTAGRVTGWLAYSFMWTERSIGGERFHPHYDRRHNLNLVFTLHRLPAGTDLTLRWTLGSGLPYSGVVGYYPKPVERPGGGTTREWVFLPGARDEFRYPWYHRLDLGLESTIPKKVGIFEITFSLDVLNLYNAQNVLLYYWDLAESGLPVRHQVNMLPILPTLGITARF